MFLDHYYKARMLYKRRLQLLDILDGCGRDAFNEEDYTMKEDDPKMIILRKQFANVSNTINAEEKSEKIYQDHLYNTNYAR